MRPIPNDQLTNAARAIEAGELVIVPTERWYMICADATNTAACHSIFEGKQRPRGKSLVLVTPSMDHCQQLFTLHPEAHCLAQTFWPGNLALLLPWRNPDDTQHHSPVGSPALVTHAPGTLGTLAARTRVPIAATTVNISGDAGIDAPGPAITYDEVNAFLSLTGLKPAVTLDGGVSPAANHLTIVDCSKPHAQLVRAGLVHERSLNAAIGRDLTTPAT